MKNKNQGITVYHFGAVFLEKGNAKLFHGYPKLVLSLLFGLRKTVALR